MCDSSSFPKEKILADSSLISYKMRLRKTLGKSIRPFLCQGGYFSPLGLKDLTLNHLPLL